MTSQVALIRRPDWELFQRALQQPLAKLIGLALCAWPLLVLAQQLALLGLATLLSTVLAGHVPNPGVADDIYWRLAVDMLAGARPIGLQLPFGVLFAPGASMAGIQLVEVAVDSAMVLLGVLLLVVSFARPRRLAARRFLHSAELRTVAGLCLLVAAAAELRLSWTSGGGEMALSMVATKLAGQDTQSYEQTLTRGAALSMGIDALLVLAAALVGGAIALGALRLWAGRRTVYKVASSARRGWRPAVALCALVLVLSPVQRLATSDGGRVRVAAAAETAAANSEDVPDSDDDLPRATSSRSQDGVVPPARASQRPLLKPSVVTVTAQDDKFEYRVDGRLEFIRGIGYNPVTLGKPAEVRAAVYDRDFAAMRGLAANTVVGWDEPEFDGVLMDRAAANGLGVILPFNLKPTWNYEDSDVRQRLTAELGLRVVRFKDSPSLRMWGVGNEVLHDMTKARSKPAAIAAFATYVIDAADLIHRLDPNHPVVYRDAEDVYLKPLATALAADRQARPWFVYGMNFFTNRLDEALTKGPARTLKQPLLISEFGPVGLRPSDRPAGYVKLWNIIKAHNDTLLGGCAYVWSTAGPEPLDRTFGLTNDGTPVDGSAAALASQFSTDQARETATPLK